VARSVRRIDKVNEDFSEAVLACKSDEAIRCLDLGADPNIDINGASALYRAVEMNSLPFVERLLRHSDIDTER